MNRSGPGGQPGSFRDTRTFTEPALSVARKQKKTAQKDCAAEVPRRIVQHIRALGLGDIAAYKTWSFARGFAFTLEKQQRSLKAERNAHDLEEKKKGERKRLERNPRRAIEALCRGDLRSEDVIAHTLRPLAEHIERSRKSKDARESLARLLLLVDRKASFLYDTAVFGNESHHYVEALVSLNARRRQWIRSLEDWRPKSHNRRKQFSSLARHLLSKYDVPLFMDSVWFGSDRASCCTRDSFVLIGNGGNIRTAKTPIPLTKKMAHYFLSAPSHYTVDGAIRWGQIHALKGGMRLSNALVATRLGESFENEDFWVTVIRFFIRNPMLDRMHVGPIIDYLQNQRYEWRQVFTAPGVREPEPPPQPNLSMRGRTPESLLQQVENWHGRLGRDRRAGTFQWENSGVPPLELETGKRGKDVKVWRIRELLSSQELHAEGRTMRHCVATYAGSCHSGKYSIWTMEVESFRRVEKRQTIAVNRHGLIVQSRGKRNVPPNQQEREFLMRWAQEAGLKVSRYVVE